MYGLFLKSIDNIFYAKRLFLYVKHMFMLKWKNKKKKEMKSRVLGMIWVIAGMISGILNFFFSLILR